MKKVVTLFLFCTLIGPLTFAQGPSPALVGYWQNWNTAGSPYIALDQIDMRYNVVELAFAVPHSGTDYQMEFIPSQVTQAQLILQIQSLQSLGKKVIISMGGANDPISLHNVTERDVFISTMTSILNTYGFDGMDIDFEGSSISVSGGTIAAPVDPPIINLIYAVKQIMSNYYSAHGKRLILTMAPETAFVQGGMSAYSGIWGAYLPVIHALRDSLDMLNVQLYNSGSMYGINGGIYYQGTADFIVAETEAVIQGFNTAGGYFAGLPASKVGVGLPASADAAGGGFIDTATVKDAIDYLRGTGPKPGSYTLAQPAGYPNLRGMMTWSINWDAVTSGPYKFADNYARIFGGPAIFSWSEGFENGGTIPVNWSQEQVAGSGVFWTFISGSGNGHPSNAHTGTYNACFKDNTTADNKTKLITPPLDLSLVSNPVLRFWHTQIAQSGRQDQLAVFYKTSLSESWIQLASYTASISSWTEETITLPATSSTFYIAFEGNAKYGRGVCLDDVSLTGTMIATKTVNLALFLEGLYTGNSAMHPVMDESGYHWGATVADKLGIELHSGSNYSTLIYAATDVSLSTGGTTSFTLPSSNNGNYYITVIHRNHILTTTSLPVSFISPTINYSFDSPVKAYGNNIRQMPDGIYVFYAGDENQDGILDGSDLSDAGNQANLAATGYLQQDVTGDGLVDGSDLSVIENNASLAIGMVTP
jgi:chitinase